MDEMRVESERRQAAPGGRFRRRSRGGRARAGAGERRRSASTKPGGFQGGLGYIDLVVCLGGDGVILRVQLFQGPVPPSWSSIRVDGFPDEPPAGADGAVAAAVGRPRPPDGGQRQGHSHHSPHALECSMVKKRDSSETVARASLPPMRLNGACRPRPSPFLSKIDVIAGNSSPSRQTACVATATGSRHSVGAGGSMVHPNVRHLTGPHLPTPLLRPVSPVGGGGTAGRRRRQVQRVGLLRREGAMRTVPRRLIYVKMSQYPVPTVNRGSDGSFSDPEGACGGNGRNRDPSTRRARVEEIAQIKRRVARGKLSHWISSDTPDQTETLTSRGHRRLRRRRPTILRRRRRVGPTIRLSAAPASSSASTVIAVPRPTTPPPTPPPPPPPPRRLLCSSLHVGKRERLLARLRVARPSRARTRSACRRVRARDPSAAPPARPTSRINGSPPPGFHRATPQHRRGGSRIVECVPDPTPRFVRHVHLEHVRSDGEIDGPPARGASRPASHSWNAVKTFRCLSQLFSGQADEVES